jgi:hypothetical protein
MKKKKKIKNKIIKQLEKEYLARQLIIVDRLKWEKIKGSK